MTKRQFFSFLPPGNVFIRQEPACCCIRVEEGGKGDLGTVWLQRWGAALIRRLLVLQQALGDMGWITWGRNWSIPVNNSTVNNSFTAVLSQAVGFLSSALVVLPGLSPLSLGLVWTWSVWRNSLLCRDRSIRNPSTKACVDVHGVSAKGRRVRTSGGLRTSFQGCWRRWSCCLYTDRHPHWLSCAMQRPRTKPEAWLQGLYRVYYCSQLLSWSTGCFCPH